MISIGDTVSAGGIDAYKVESINNDGVATCHWECGQYVYVHISRLTKLDFIYVGDERIEVN